MVNKTIGIFHNLQSTLPRTSLITIFKSFIRSHLGDGDIIYDRAYNTSFHQNIESVQHNVALAITRVVRETSREKPYQELGFESLQQRRWYRKPYCLFQIINNQSSRYLFSVRPLTKHYIFFTKLPNFGQSMTFSKTLFFPRLKKSGIVWTSKSENRKG